MDHEQEAPVAGSGAGGHGDVRGEDAPVNSPVPSEQALMAIQGEVRADGEPSAAAVISVAASRSSQKRAAETDSDDSDHPYGRNYLAGYENEVSTANPN